MVNRRAICYVLMSFPQPSETFIADEALSIVGRGVDVQVLHINNGNRSVVHASAQAVLDGQRVHKLRESGALAKLKALGGLLMRRPWATWSTLRRLHSNPERWRYLQVLPAAQALAVQRVGYVHAHFADNNLLVAQALAAWLGCPFGVTLHGYDIRDQPIPRARASAALERASLVVAISRLNRTLLERDFKTRRERVRVVHCGIDLQRFTFRRSHAPARHGGGLLVAVGRLVALKGHSDLLQAMALLRVRGIDCRLEIVGGGPLRQPLLEQVEALGLAGRVHLWGVQTSDRVIDIVSAADVFVLPSHEEGLPVVCIESMALGVPVVATAVSAVPELITDGVSGLLVPARNPPALADAIQGLLIQPDRARELAIAGRRKVEREFDRERCTDELLAAIDQAWAQHLRG